MVTSEYLTVHDSVDVIQHAYTRYGKFSNLRNVIHALRKSKEDLRTPRFPGSVHDTSVIIKHLYHNKNVRSAVKCLMLMHSRFFSWHCTHTHGEVDLSVSVLTER